jgi:hypothetical protein
MASKKRQQKHTCRQDEADNADGGMKKRHPTTLGCEEHTPEISLREIAEDERAHRSFPDERRSFSAHMGRARLVRQAAVCV